MATQLGTTELNLNADLRITAPVADSKLLPLNQPDERHAPTLMGKHVFILLVDDNPADVLLVREALKWHEVKSELIVARDGDDAIHIMDEIDSELLPCPNLVVLDLNLPRKTGFEVLVRIRSSPCCGETPVVVLSSSDALADRQKAKLLGASQYLQKPSNLHDFMSIGAKLKDALAGADQRGG